VADGSRIIPGGRQQG